MKKKILLGFGLLLGIFLCGSIIAALYITRTTQRMDRLIMLHQVEILREDLIIRVQQVQSHIFRDQVRDGNDADVLIAQVQEMDRVMDTCVGCHHSPELTRGLAGMRDMADDYKAAISRLLTASANPQRMTMLEHRVQEIGRDLITMTQGMAFTANVRLQQKTQETMATIRDVRNILYLMLTAGFLLALAVSWLLMRSLDKRLRELLNATRRIAAGDLQHRIDIDLEQSDEFKELGDAFNTMTANLHRSQRQLVQSSKLAAIGELATNIAYEVNNPLTGVLGYAGLLLKADDIPFDKKEQIKTIERETLRAREILKHVLEFSRRKPPRLVKTDIPELVQDTLKLLQGQARTSNVTIDIQCSRSLFQLAVDADEMKQVYLNLISNAFAAMPRGGALTIRCREIRDVSGDVVIVEISDTGHGIPEEQLDKIFDPFFTTRADGTGTGLGLSISYMIVQNHGGRIEVDSEVGRGSTFRIILPAAVV